ncbi:putative E3 ubiquitin-protein ligase RFWD3 [Helianthus debilis subsp. tardiflorus]
MFKRELMQKTKYLERLLKDRQREPFTSNLGYQRRVINGNGSGSVFCPGAFTLQVDGGRYFDIDASGQLMIVARRQNGTGGTSILSKISLLAPNEREDIHLPAYTKAVRALCVRPCTRQALVASLGKKLSIVR